MADTATPRRDLIVIGASAGGVEVLLALSEALPANFPACILIVQHIGAHPSYLPELLNRKGPLRAAFPDSGQVLESGRIYVAPPDQHLLVVDGAVRLTREAKENHARPAIDPLFRSAAVARGSRVIGVVLSGRLDDGTAGLQAIKACGGVALVQDPDDAEEPGMPRSALENAAIDQCVTAATLPDALMRLAGQPVAPPAPAPARVRCEHQLTIGEGNDMEHLDTIGAPSRFSCPDCNGVLWKLLDSQPPRYRCHTGHAYTQRTLEYTQSQRADDALWTALRTLHEREALLEEMALTCRERGQTREADEWQRQAEAAATEARQLEQLVTEA